MFKHIDRRTRWLAGELLFGLIAFVAPATSIVATAPTIPPLVRRRNPVAASLVVRELS